jgi:hypothetical protein
MTVSRAAQGVGCHSDAQPFSSSLSGVTLTSFQRSAASRFDRQSVNLADKKTHAATSKSVPATTRIVFMAEYDLAEDEAAISNVIEPVGGRRLPKVHQRWRVATD